MRTPENRNMNEQYQIIEHAQRCLALNSWPLSHPSAKRPYKLTTQFYIGYLHSTYHVTEEEAHATYKVMLEVFGDTAIDVERSGDVERVWKQDSGDITAQAYRASL
jgi:hypothetical protein